MMEISKDIRYIGVNDHSIDLFEGQYTVPNGMAYNSYLVCDEKVAVMDTVDGRFLHEWLDAITRELGDRAPDYLVVQHMEPDHSANIASFMDTYPNAVLVSSQKAFAMMKNFFGKAWEERRMVVSEGSTLCLGSHTLSFVAAPMVHWPEVLVTYDSKDKVLFSADGFGKFGALDVEEEWDCEARRYYIGIVGKYGAQVQSLLKKASSLEIETICPLHGPVLKENLGHYIGLYDIWSRYAVESDGILVAYTSVYGHTKEAALKLGDMLKSRGCPKVVLTDLARDDMAEAVEDAFRYGKLVLATTTYNAEIFPFMHTFINHLKERNYQNRTVGFIENGSWAPLAAKIMKKSFEGSPNIKFAENTVHILSALSESSLKELESLADELCEEYVLRGNVSKPSSDPKALFNIGYGLYAVTTKDEKGRDNALIVNTVTQLSDTPVRIAVTINKQNYSHHLIRHGSVMNVNCLTEETPFSFFERFGFRSGRAVNKFEGFADEISRTQNGLAVFATHANAVLSLKVEDYVDLGTHGMFICSLAESKVLSKAKSMTYAYYHASVKPRPPSGEKKGYVCRICGYVHEGDTLPDDIVCPLCKHGAADFEKLQ